MSNKQNKRTKISDQAYSFYWNYNDQAAINRKKRDQKRNRGVIVYVTVLSAVLLVGIAMLTLAGLWAMQNPDAWLGEGTEPAQTNPQQTPPQQTPPQQTPPQQTPPQQTFPGETPDTATVVAQVMPSVVLVEVSRGDTGGSGTGFFISSDGYIVTNYHVVENTLQILITLYDGRQEYAEIVGFRAEDDVAVLKIPGWGYSPAAIGDSDVLFAGDVAIAIGHPGGADDSWSATKGIISATNRILSVEEDAYFCEMKMLQTDASVNPGNSGGPLCNANGEVIGIITRKRTTYEGMGYAIPITDAMRTVNAILAGELEGFVSTVSKSRPKIGITGTNIARGERFTLGGREYTAPAPGFFVIEVSANTAAYGKIEIGDILCSVNGVTVTDMDSFKNELYKCYVGQNVTFEIYRRGQKITVQIVIGVS